MNLVLHIWQEVTRWVGELLHEGMHLLHRYGWISSPGDRLLVILILAILFFFALSILFALLTLWLRGVNSRQERRQLRLEAAWTPRLFSVLEGESNPGELQSIVKHRDRLEFLRYLVDYSERTRSDREKDILAHLAEPYVSIMLRYVKSRRAERRALAVQTLGALVLARHAGVIIVALEDESPLVAMTAARILIRRRSLQYVEPVLERLERFTTWNTAYLSSMLTAVGTEGRPLIRALLADDSRESSVRRIAAEALRLMGDAESADLAAEILEKTRDRELTTACLRLLRKLGRPEHAMTVRKLLMSRDDIVRTHAMSTIGVVGHDLDRISMMEGLDNPSIWIATHAAWGLKQMGAVEELEHIAASDHPRSELVRQVLDEGVVL